MGMHAKLMKQKHSHFNTKEAKGMTTEWGTNGYNLH